MCFASPFLLERRVRYWRGAVVRPGQPSLIPGVMFAACGDRQKVLMTSIFLPVLAIHILFGLICVAIGWMPLITRKGGRLHRLSGRVFSGAMAVLLIAAWIMTVIHFSAYFLALTAMATLGLFSGLRVLDRKRPDLKREDRARPLDWLVTSGIVGVALTTLYLTMSGAAGGGFAVSAALAAAGLVYGVYDLWRFCAPTAWPFSPRLWMYEHLVKMIGAYSAVWAAFSGNFMTFIPAPWSPLWPSLVFQALALGWLVWLVRQRPAFAVLP